MDAIVLFGIFGGLGSGKTLTSTYLTFDHWFQRREQIFSNYHLFKIPYYHIEAISQMDFVRNGWATYDELWRIINARTPMAKRNQIVYDVLGRSRKRGITINFTAQLIKTMDRNVRDVLDFVSSPSLAPDELSAKLSIFMGNKASPSTHMKDVRFITAPFFSMYDTDEEIDMLPESDRDPLLIFQPNYNPHHGYLCQCKECGTKYFEKWKDADAAAEAWWNENFSEMFPNLKV